MYLCCVHGWFLGALEELNTAVSLVFSFGPAPARFWSFFATGVPSFVHFCPVLLHSAGFSILPLFVLGFLLSDFMFFIIRGVLGWLVSIVYTYMHVNFDLIL